MNQDGDIPQEVVNRTEGWDNTVEDFVKPFDFDEWSNKLKNLYRKVPLTPDMSNYVEDNFDEWITNIRSEFTAMGVIPPPLSPLEQEKKNFLELIPKIEFEHDVDILLAYVRGSHMYGTSTDKSDVDITFVYRQPTDTILKSEYMPQLNIGGNDVVGYEIERFLELLTLNNPNILESLDIPEDCMIYCDDYMVEVLDQSIWVSKLAEDTILGYAQSQVKKATGLNKNMNNAQPKERKSILEFCYVVIDGNTMPFYDFLTICERVYGIKPDPIKWGLVKMDNGKQLYALYPNKDDEFFRGLVKEDSVNLRTSDVPNRSRRDSFTFVYNLDGFEIHCKQHAAYWKWEEERNEERHLTNQGHGKNYDSKNMMHLMRLLQMAHNVATSDRIVVRQANTVSWLLNIKKGEFEYDQMIKDAERFTESIKRDFTRSRLKDRPDSKQAKEILLKFRKIK